MLPPESKIGIVPATSIRTSKVSLIFWTPFKISIKDIIDSNTAHTIYLLYFKITLKRKRKISYSVLWQKPHCEKPLCQQKFQKAEWQHKMPHKFYYTAIADQLRMFGWSSYSYATCVINLLASAQLSHCPQQPCNKTVLHLKKCK